MALSACRSTLVAVLHIAARYRLVAAAVAGLLEFLARCRLRRLRRRRCRRQVAPAHAAAEPAAQRSAQPDLRWLRSAPQPPARTRTRRRPTESSLRLLRPLILGNPSPHVPTRRAHVLPLGLRIVERTAHVFERLAHTANGVPLTLPDARLADAREPTGRRLWVATRHPIPVRGQLRDARRPLGARPLFAVLLCRRRVASYDSPAPLGP